MELKSIQRRFKQFIQCILTLLVFAFPGLNAVAELRDSNIPSGVQIQPPTRFLWRGGLGGGFIGQTEETIIQNRRNGWEYYASPKNALDVVIPITDRNSNYDTE